MSKKNEGQVTLLSSKKGWFAGEDRYAQFSEPSFTLTLENGGARLKAGKGAEKINGAPLAILEDFLEKGYFAIGYFGYEFFEKTGFDFKPRSSKNGVEMPQACFMFFEEPTAQGKISELNCESDYKNLNSKPQPNVGKSEFLRMVRSVQKYIELGDVYQVNLSQRFDLPFIQDPEKFLLKLYGKQPVPFACSLDFGDFNIVSGSMELFLRKKGNKVVTRPIKGTRARGRGNKRDLFESEKERAENLMIVDLMRNDLGRVCDFGSVRVNRLFKIEPYSTLYQMVSEVEGKLRDGVGVADVIKATFPPGSVTGAPKRRAMEIIDELEPHMRGPYCGAIGFFEPGGDFTLSVAIRVLASSGRTGHLWVGGGITWSSVPELEYEETLVKALAMMMALA